MTKVNINLLGGLEFSGLDEGALTRKVKALAAFLALQQGQPQPRERIATLFWGNSPEEQARTNLRQSLSSLRKQLKDALITRDDLVQLDTTLFELDVARFEALITSGDDQQIEQALSIYKGDLLDGFSIKEEGFESWLRPERERLRKLMIDGLARLISTKEASGDHAAISTLAARLLVLDPINEAAHRSLMKAYAAQGRYEAALKQYETCKQRLDRELGVVPQPATQAVMRDIRKNRNNPTAPATEEVDGELSGGIGSSLPGCTLADQSPVRYVQSSDGVSIAYADVGTGYPMLFLGGWMTHLEKDWDSPVMRYFLTHLSKSYRLIRFDQRGNGMSDWSNVDISFERMVDDVEHVIDRYDFEKLALCGTSQGAAVAIAYAVRHPDRASHLILHGGYARGRCKRGDPGQVAESEAMVNLIRHRWGADNPAFRQYITSLFMPDASREDAAWFNEFQRTCGPGENMARFREMFDKMDISHLLEQVRVPTLVLHCSGDAVAPISEGKFLASRTPDAQFVLLNSQNHMILEDEPDFPKFVQAIRDFVG